MSRELRLPQRGLGRPESASFGVVPHSPVYQAEDSGPQASHSPIPPQPFLGSVGNKDSEKSHGIVFPSKPTSWGLWSLRGIWLLNLLPGPFAQAPTSPGPCPWNGRSLPCTLTSSPFGAGVPDGWAAVAGPQALMEEHVLLALLFDTENCLLRVLFDKIIIKVIYNVPKY